MNVTHSDGARRRYYDRKAQAKIAAVMREFSARKLRHRSGKIVTDPAVAKAIALSEARKSGGHVPRKR